MNKKEILNIFKKIGIYEEKDIVTYDGTGYIQGMGCIFSTSKLHIGPLVLVTDVKFDVEGEWTKKMREKLKADYFQTEIWKKHTIKKK